MRRWIRRARWVASAAGVIGLWLLGATTALGEFDFSTGSLLESQPLPAPAVSPPASSAIESLPPALPAEAANGSFGFPDSPFAAPVLPMTGSGLAWHLGGQGRGYYINDQRIEFTGMEDTFAVEGVLNGGLLQPAGDWTLSVETQLFFNQPFDRHILLDTPERRSFAANFDRDVLEISQLYLCARRGDFLAALGRFVTPFGRFYFPNYRNNFDDSPFIRSEAILFRETGLLLQWDPGIWVASAAVANGGFGQDSNSSKALVARVGIDQPWYAAGASIKWQDGIGSESHKVYNNHVGLDGMIRRGPWTLSGEVIYDEYGRRRAGLPNDITWGRSLYYRDMNHGRKPITGVGYYVNLGYESPQWTLMLNYGEFYPEQLGRRKHDAVTRRGLIKLSRHWTEHFETYGIALIENDLPDSFDNSTRRGIDAILGGQFTW
jgi:hypothetical protein